MKYDNSPRVLFFTDYFNPFEAILGALFEIDTNLESVFPVTGTGL